MTIRGHQQLRDEILLREASLADARREREAGELSDAEATSIEERETSALARAREELAALEREEILPRRQRRRRRWLLVSALGCFAGAAVILLVAYLVPRQPGTSITGSIALSPAQRVTQLLDEAEADVADNDVTDALVAYHDVLALEPTNVAALTQTGWLTFSAGSTRSDVTLVDEGLKELRTAIADHPRNPAPRLYYAIAADSTPGNEALAKGEFKVFLALHPSAGQLEVAAPFLKAIGLSR